MPRLARSRAVLQDLRHRFGPFWVRRLTLGMRECMAFLHGTRGLQQQGLPLPAPPKRMFRIIDHIEAVADQDLTSDALKNR